MAAVGTVVITRSQNTPSRMPWKLQLDWTCDGAGAVSGTLTSPIMGKLERVVTVPAVGATQPDDNYDVTLLDEQGLDVLMGRGANRDETNAEQIAPGIAFTDGTTLTCHQLAIVGTLELRIASAGALGNQGTVILYFS